MSQLVVKLIALAALLLAVRIAFLPFYKPEQEQRFDAFAQGSYSTAFVGSSRTKCSVIPAYFDQLIHDPPVSSYNFGVDTTSMPTTLDWSAKLINRNPSLKHIFIEISGSGATASDGSDLENRIRAISTRIDRSVLSIFRPVLPSDVPFFDHNRPLAQLGEPCRRHEKISDSDIQAAARRSRSIEQEWEFGEKAKIAEEIKAEIAVEYADRITNLLDHARSRGVSVHFFVPPLIPLDGEAESIRAIYRFLPAENKLAVNRDATIYSRNNAADAWHLNQHGALIFTQRLADSVRQKQTGR